MEYFKEIFNAILTAVESLWKWPLFTVGEQVFTFQTIFLVVLFVFLSFMGASYFSRYLSRKVFSQLKDLDDSVQEPLRKISFYVILVFLLLMTLSFLQISLTIFTFLGGFLVVALGFGSQKIANNLMSGFILMVERPIRVGDVVEIGEVQGKVEVIGSRSTKVRSVDNTSIVVPNSFFLEEKVLNWTLSDRIVRSVLKVGVAYGSPVEQVKELLEEVIKNHGKVLSHPEPVVIFEDFGSSSLVFDVYYYSYIQSIIQIKIIASELRFEIVKVFSENNIEIAFPQQDVHFKSPLQVEMLKHN